MIPSFQPDGLLPPGDYEVCFKELRKSILTVVSCRHGGSPIAGRRLAERLVDKACRVRGVDAEFRRG
jgi:hypothetical protein